MNILTSVEISARYENGVFVPEEKVNLPEHERVTLTFDRKPTLTREEALDPMPAGGVELVDWWERHRIPAPPGVTDRIARSKAYENNEEPDDEA